MFLSIFAIRCLQIYGGSEVQKHLTITPFEPFGAVVSGIDLGKEVSVAVAHEIRSTT